MEDEVHDRLQFASKSDDVELVESDDDFCESYHNKLKELKRKLELSISHEKKKMKLAEKPKDAFTCFSVMTLSTVLESLTPNERHVIERYGFGYLLQFDKCFVPNQFSKWVANVVDYKSGDIVVDGKVISLTKESFHYMLGIPIGGSTFPNDTIWQSFCSQ